MFDKKQLVFTIVRHAVRAVVVAVLALIVIVVLSRRIAHLGEELAENKRLIFLLSNKSDVTERLRTDFALVGNVDKALESAFPRAENLLVFIAALESLATEKSVQQSLKFADPVPFAIEGSETGVLGIDYNATMSGNIVTFLNYLRGFERLPYFTGISGISITSPGSRGWEEDSTISFQAKVYAQ